MTEPAPCEPRPDGRGGTIHPGHYWGSSSTPQLAACRDCGLPRPCRAIGHVYGTTDHRCPACGIDTSNEDRRAEQRQADLRFIARWGRLLHPWRPSTTPGARPQDRRTDVAP